MREDLCRFLEEGSAAQLFEHHRRFFAHRTSRLHPILMPGRDKSESAIASLANGAFASFAHETTYPGPRAAFRFAYEEHPRRESQLLYYWRDSATDRYLRRVADDVTRAYLNLLRSTRSHLNRAFAVVGKHGAQALYAPAEWSAERRARPAAEHAMTLRCDAKTRGVQAIREVLEAAESPLTAVQLTSIIWLSRGYVLDDTADAARGAGVFEKSAPEVEEQLLEEEVRHRARAHFEALSELERELLWARGYGDAGERKRSFRDVAELLGRYVPERYRQMERAIFETIQETFDPDERPILARTWAELIGEHTKKSDEVQP